MYFNIDSVYIEYMHNVKDKNFFICSDEKVDKFKKIFGNRIITRDIENRSRDLEGVQEAIVDLWLLSNTNHIIRGVGTFAMCASTIKGRKNTNIFSDKEFICFYK